MPRYSPADWYGVVTAAGVALLPPTVPLAAVERVWQALRDGNGPDAVLDGLVAAFGTSFSSLPDFALLSQAGRGGVRVVLRGAVEAILDVPGSDEPERQTGTGVTTWSEHYLDKVGRAELAVIGASTQARLPIADAVVLAGRIVVEVGSIAPAPGPAPAIHQSPAEPPRAETEAVEVAPHPADPLESVAPDAESNQLSAPALPVSPIEEPALEPVESPGGDEPIADVSAELGADELAAAAESPDLLEAAPVESLAPVESVDSADVAGSAEALEAAKPPAAKSRSAETLVGSEAPNEYDRLLMGETVISSVEAAAVRPQLHETALEVDAPPAPLAAAPLMPPPPPPPPAVPATGLIAQVPGISPEPEESWADHDGETVMVQDLLAHVQASASAAEPNPVAQWSPPRLLLPGKEPVILNRSAIVGVRPRFSRIQDGNVPLLVMVESPNAEISRSHLELRLESRSLLAVDLNSTNGSVLLRQGADPVRLHPGEPSLLVAGDRVDLGDGVVLSFEGLE